jgi:phage gp16-like protein
MADDAAFRGDVIKKIHIAKADLKLDDDRYRAMLLGLTGKDSCKDMTLRELNQVYRQMEKDGFVVKVKKGRTTRKPENNAFQKKIWAIWFDLKDKGLVSGGNAALNKIVKRQTGIESIDWIYAKQDADPIIECLKAMQKRGVKE